MLRSAFFATGAILLLPAVGHAQSAWVGPQGSASASLGYQHTRTNGNYGNLEEKYTVSFEDLETFSVHTVFIGAEYAITDKLAVNAVLPWTRIRFTGDVTFLPHGPEDGHHDSFSTFTDLTAYARYSLDVSDNFKVAPLVGFNIPVQDYPVEGHAIASKGLWDVRAGAAAGYANQSLFTQLLAYHRFSETVEPWERFDQDSTHAILSAGYFVLDQLTVYAAADYHYTWGGNTFKDLGPIVADLLNPEMPPVSERDQTIFANHDQAVKEVGLIGFGGLSYQVLPFLRADGTYMRTLWGDTMQTAHAFNVQLTYMFIPE